MDGEEVLGLAGEGSPDDGTFDRIVGHLQDIVMEPEFQTVRDGFIDKHKDTFEDAEENKLEYTPIFKDWCALIETHLDTNLKARIPGFKMSAFMKMLDPRHEEVDVELLDTLLSLGDFQAFKETMLMSKQAGGGDPFGDALTVLKF
mmetsp:Transcript_28836/g.75659  ORF Transcript_28836/g.75659 Transcript_28836/m.75659 type:complete len:146 (+) Transcript_28836:117-554(+)